MTDIKNSLEYLCSSRFGKVMVASHRGKFGAGVMENTVLAFETAIGQGADMVEMDLMITRDGTLVGHHDNTLQRLFGIAGRPEDLTYEELQQLSFNNYFAEPCAEKLETFDMILEALKGRTILVLDKCWDHWDQVYRSLKKMDMTGQTVFKFYIEDTKALAWAGSHPELIYIPMVADPACMTQVEWLRERAALPAIEILPQKDTDLLFQKSFISGLHEKGIKVWCNSLSFSKDLIFGAGYDDVRSMRYGGDCGWGVQIERGVDILQTDWPYELKKYLGPDGLQGGD